MTKLPDAVGIASVVIRPVEQFPEPDFSHLQRMVFADAQQTCPELAAQMGTLVELTLHCSGKRHDLFRARAVPYVVPGT